MFVYEEVKRHLQERGYPAVNGIELLNKINYWILLEQVINYSGNDRFPLEYGQIST